MVLLRFIIYYYLWLQTERGVGSTEPTDAGQSSCPPTAGGQHAGEHTIKC